MRQGRHTADLRAASRCAARRGLPSGSARSSAGPWGWMHVVVCITGLEAEEREDCARWVEGLSAGAIDQVVLSPELQPDLFCSCTCALMPDEMGRL